MDRKYYSQNASSEKSEFLGTWEYKQPNNPHDDILLKLVVNEDGTALAIKKSKQGEEIFYATIMDGYLYVNSQMAKAKNPEQRAKLNKVN